MYAPASFDERRAEILLSIARAHPLATVIGQLEGGSLEIAHVPLLVEPGEPLRLRGHVARANPIARLIGADQEVTAVFQGPDAYVSASWYAAPAEQVPTWNFAVVHARGRMAALGEGELPRLLDAMAARFEADPPAWRREMLDPSFFDSLARAIVGFELVVESIQGKLKLSQNRSDEDRVRVQRALEASESARDREVAALMARASERERD